MGEINTLNDEIDLTGFDSHEEDCDGLELDCQICGLKLRFTRYADPKEIQKAIRTHRANDCGNPIS